MEKSSLEEYFDFDEDDLAANRDKRLSQKQIARLDALRKHKPGFEWGIGALLFVFAAAGIYAAGVSLFQDVSIGARIVFVLIFGVIWPYFFVKLGWVMIDSTRPGRDVHVKVERGRLRIEPRDGRDIVPYYDLRVGDRTVEVEDDLSNLVEEGETYAMYYLAKTKGVLSMERIDKGERL